MTSELFTEADQFIDRKAIEVSETQYLRKLLRISRLEHKTNDWVWSKINLLVGPQEPLLSTVKETETCMVWARHTPRQPLQSHP